MSNSSATPWTAAHPPPLSMGFSRQEYLSGLPFPTPGDLPNPGIEPRSPAWQADSLPSEPPGTWQVVKMVNFMSSVFCHNKNKYLKIAIEPHLIKLPFDIQLVVCVWHTYLILLHIFKKMFIYLLTWVHWALVAALGIFKLCCSMQDF